MITKKLHDEPYPDSPFQTKTNQAATEENIKTLNHVKE